MPEDIPKAVLILIWLLCGVIIFGYLLMQYSEMHSLAFALMYFGLPVLAHRISRRSST